MEETNVIEENTPICTEGTSDMSTVDAVLEEMTDFLESDEDVETEEILDLPAMREELISQYPNADVEEFLVFPRVDGLLKGREKISLCEAYRLIHFDKIMKLCAERAAAEAEERLIGHIRACGMRPSENGTATVQGSRNHASVSRLNRDERARIAARAGRGEHIEF